MTVKKRFIAGAKCLKCHALDRVMLMTTKDDEWIECVECGYTERRPTEIEQPSLQSPLQATQGVTNSPLKADEIGVVRFKPVR